MQARIVLGYTKTDGPDDTGITASSFVEAVRDQNHARVWGLMTKESRGLAAGAWITSHGRELHEVYAVSRTTSHPEFDELFRDFCQGLISDWGEHNLEQLGIAPTKYMDENRALVRLIIGVTEPVRVTEDTAAPTIIVPMMVESREWKFHLPGTLWVDE